MPLWQQGLEYIKSVRMWEECLVHVDMLRASIWPAKGLLGLSLVSADAVLHQQLFTQFGKYKLS